MPRQPKEQGRTDGSTRHTITFPTRLFLQIESLLWSKMEDRVPYGAWPAFVIPILEKEVNRILKEKKEQQK